MYSNNNRPSSSNAPKSQPEDKPKSPVTVSHSHHNADFRTVLIDIVQTAILFGVVFYIAVGFQVQADLLVRWGWLDNNSFTYYLLVAVKFMLLLVDSWLLLIFVVPPVVKLSKAQFNQLKSD